MFLQIHTVGESAFEDSILNSSNNSVDRDSILDIRTIESHEATGKANTNPNINSKEKDLFYFEYNKKRFSKMNDEDEPKRPPTVSLIHSDTSQEKEHFLKMTSREKLSGMMRIEDNYAAKWLKMKSQRDLEHYQQMKLTKRKNIMHTVQRIAINSDKDELYRIQHAKRAEKTQEVAAMREEFVNRRKKHEMVITRRLEKSLKKKTQEAKHLKKSIKDSVALAKDMIAQDIQNKLDDFREKHLTSPIQRSRLNHSLSSPGGLGQDSLTLSMDGSLNKSSLSMFSNIVDDASSTIIKIPDEIVNRVKTAKSLLQYENAKKEMREFQEKTLSERIQIVTKKKEEAKVRAQSFGSKISINPIRASELFSDSISCDSEDFSHRLSWSSKG